MEMHVYFWRRILADKLQYQGFLIVHPVKLLQAMFSHLTMLTR